MPRADSQRARPQSYTMRPGAERLARWKKAAARNDLDLSVYITEIMDAAYERRVVIEGSALTPEPAAEVLEELATFSAPAPEPEPEPCQHELEFRRSLGWAMRCDPALGGCGQLF